MKKAVKCVKMYAVSCQLIVLLYAGRIHVNLHRDICNANFQKGPRNRILHPKYICAGSYNHLDGRYKILVVKLPDVRPAVADNAWYPLNGVG